jgi:hypothetical protein
MSNIRSGSYQMHKKYSSKLMQIFKDQSGVFKERQSNNAVPLATRTLRPDLHHVKAEHMEKHL